MTQNPASRRATSISILEFTTLGRSRGDVVLLDVRFTPGKPGRKESYLAGHLPGALYVDLPTELADPEARAKGRGANPLPVAAKLQADLRRLGINKTSSVIIYDDTNGAPAARAWWVLTWAGLPHVKLLDGGLTAWRAAGHAVVTGQTLPTAEGDVEIAPGKLAFLGVDEVGSFPAIGTLVDVRPAAAFTGNGNTHIPGARNFPAELLLRPSNELISGTELADRLKHAGIDISRPIAAYCGGGIASSLFTFALAEIGKEVSLYPGSWSEWTADGTRPVEP